MNDKSDPVPWHSLPTGAVLHTLQGAEGGLGDDEVKPRLLHYGPPVAINTLVMGELVYLFNSRYILEPVCSRAPAFWATVPCSSPWPCWRSCRHCSPTRRRCICCSAPPPSVFGVALFALVEMEKAVFKRRAHRVV